MGCPAWGRAVRSDDSVEDWLVGSRRSQILLFRSGMIVGLRFLPLVGRAAKYLLPDKRTSASRWQSPKSVVPLRANSRRCPPAGRAPAMGRNQPRRKAGCRQAGPPYQPVKSPAPRDRRPVGSGAAGWPAGDGLAPALATRARDRAALASIHTLRAPRALSSRGTALPPGPHRYRGSGTSARRA